MNTGLLNVRLHHLRSLPAVLFGLAALGLTVPSPASQIEVLLRSRDEACSIAGMVHARPMAVNNRGDWIARVLTSGGDIVVKNGRVLIDNNSPRVTPNSIFGLSINNTGDTVAVVYRADAKVGEYSNGNQIYFNDRVLVTPGQVTTAPGFEPGSVYRSLYDAVINDAGHVYLVGIVDDPQSSRHSQVLVRLRVDEEGSVLGESVVFRDFGTEVALGQDRGRLANPPRQSCEWEANNAGDVLHYSSCFLLGGGHDKVLFLNEEALFREDAPSPLKGRTAKYVGACHLNNRGEWAAYVGLADGDSHWQMLIRNGEKVVELGDTLPNGCALELFSTPVYLDDDGDVYWVGRWRNADESMDGALFLNEAILVQDGDTRVEGRTVRTVFGKARGSYGVSDDGRHVIFAGYFDDGEAGLFHIPASESVAPRSALQSRRRSGPQQVE